MEKAPMKFTGQVDGFEITQSVVTSTEGDKIKMDLIARNPTRKYKAEHLHQDLSEGIRIMFKDVQTLHRMIFLLVEKKQEKGSINIEEDGSVKIGFMNVFTG